MEDYIIEKELTLPAPRTVRPKGSWRGERFLGFALVVAFLVVNACMWTYGVQRVHALRDRGRVTQGVVKHLHEYQGDNKRTSYDVKYSFTDEQGNVHVRDYYVSHELYKSLSEGGPVEVMYVPDDPKISRPWRVGDRDVTNMNWAAVALLLGSAAVLIGGFIACEKDVRKHYILGERGVPATGVVLGLRMVRWGDTYYMVSYSFQGLRGTSYRKEVYVSKALYSSLSAGSPLTILYDPERPQVSLLYTQLKVSVG